MKLSKKIRTLLPAQWQFQLNLRDLRLLQERIESKRPPSTREAHEHGLIDEFWHGISDVSQSRRTLITVNYQRIASELSVPMPDSRDEKLWEDVENSMLQLTFRCLTSDGEAAVRAAISEEKKHRREVAMFYFSIVFGLIGALTGLVSAFKS